MPVLIHTHTECDLSAKCTYKNRQIRLNCCVQQKLPGERKNRATKEIRKQNLIESPQSLHFQFKHIHANSRYRRPEFFPLLQ